jgi:hypothetical protein
MCLARVHKGESTMGTRRARFSSRLYRGLALAIILTMTLPWMVFADQADADADTVTAGVQGSTSFTVAPGALVSFNAKLIIEYHGGHHLAAGTEVTFSNNDGNGGTSLPSGYSVADAVVTIPDNWASGGSASSLSAISFTAPAAEDTYDYHVKWHTSHGAPQLTGNPQILVTVTVIAAPTDTTPPVITPTIVGTLGNNGWYTDDVTVTWTVVDGESAVTSSTGCDATTISADTAGTTLTCSATSTGGTASQSVTIKRDGTQPVVTVTGVAHGVTYILGSVPVAGCETTDETSGVATSATPSGYGVGIGQHTVTCSGAVDNAGNINSATANYTVVYDFDGFFAPINPGDNTVKAGSAVPVKFSLAGDKGLAILKAGSPSSKAIACDVSVSPNEVPTLTAGSSSLQYDGATDTYTYVWKTDKSWSGTCRMLTVMLIDGTMHTANFKFK